MNATHTSMMEKKNSNEETAQTLIKSSPRVDDKSMVHPSNDAIEVEEETVSTSTTLELNHLEADNSMHNTSLTGKKPSSYDLTTKPKTKGIDIAIMYSEPLVKKRGKDFEPLDYSIDFEEECDSLLEIFKARNQQIDLEFTIATYENFVSVITKEPVLLHVTCHGEYNRERGQFFLCFEADNGELLEFYADDLKLILARVEKSTIKLVLVNSYNSEEVARVFLDADIPCVIAIQSELQIADNATQKFSRCFYNQIFYGKTIKQAFDLAILASKSVDLHTCCCAHTHKDNCIWYKIALKEDFHRAHQLHVPLCLNCHRRNEHIHKDICIWAQNFALEFKEDFSEAPDYVGPDEVWTCCCSPELPHNESLKFKKFCKDEEVDQMVLFRQREFGTVENKDSYSMIEPKFSMKRIYGRNKEMHQMIQILTSKDQKCVQLNGGEGVGKTSTVKQLANYLYKRGYFSDKICIIMLEKTLSIAHFLSKLYKEVPGAYDFNSFCDSVKTSKALFILKNSDFLLRHYKQNFIKYLKQICEYTKHVRFIIITNECQELGLNESRVMMHDLQPYDAAKILLNHAYKYLSVMDRRIDDLASRPLLQQVRLTPQKIRCLAERLKYHALQEVEADMIYNQETEQSKREESDQAIGSTLQFTQNHSDALYSLVLLMCLFPSGLGSRDLRELKKLDMIPKDWPRLLESFLTDQAITIDNHNSGEEKEREEEEESKQEKDKEIESQKFENQDWQSLMPGNYIWMVVSKDILPNSLCYQPSQFMTKYIYKELKSDVIYLEIHKLQYLTLLSLSLIHRIKAIYHYQEKTTENNTISSQGFWMFSPENSFYMKSIKDKKWLTYVDEANEGPDAYDLAKIIKIFQLHEDNFLSCINSETIAIIIQTDGRLYEQVVDIVETCLIIIPTLFELVADEEAVSRDLALRALSTLDLLKIEDNRISCLKAKLKLFLASVNLRAEKEEEESIRPIYAALEDLHKIRAKIQNDKASQAI